MEEGEVRANRGMILTSEEAALIRRLRQAAIAQGAPKHQLMNEARREIDEEEAERCRKS